ncbi:MAG: lysylphosphatidylglycerol synthase domain-containing protein [Gemmatimonadaceae bacterium]
MVDAPRRRRVRAALQIALTLVVVLFAARTLWRQWNEVGTLPATWAPRPEWIVASCVVVLLTYALLIETWRRTLEAWGARVGFADAARVWSISNLGKYVPGKIWQLSAMTVMMRQLGVSLVASGGAAVLITVANLVAGFAAVLFFGAGAAVDRPGTSTASAAMLALSTLALLAAPYVAPRLTAVAGRLSGGRVPLVTVPPRAPWIGAVGCFVAWVAYGAAFRMFTVGVLGHAAGGTAAYVAAFTGSYLLGYLALFSPGGLGVRELALATALPALGLATPAEATVVTVASRLWLTVLEIAPGLLFLAAGRKRA